MAKKKHIPQKLNIWVEVRKRFHLSHAQIQMARELGLNPRKFGSLANQKQEPWKQPLPQFIEDIYFKRFGRERPETVKSIEQAITDRNKRKAERRAAKAQSTTPAEERSDST